MIQALLDSNWTTFEELTSCLKYSQSSLGYLIFEKNEANENAAVIALKKKRN